MSCLYCYKIIIKYVCIKYDNIFCLRRFHNINLILKSYFWMENISVTKLYRNIRITFLYSIYVNLYLTIATYIRIRFCSALNC